jgi:hypothetical protein
MNDWKWRFRNRFLPIHAAHSNPPEDVSEPIIDFIEVELQQTISQTLIQIKEQVEQEKRVDITLDAEENAYNSGLDEAVVIVDDYLKENICKD